MLLCHRRCLSFQELSVIPWDHTRILVHVAVKILSQVIVISLLFLSMVMYANEVETNEK